MNNLTPYDTGKRLEPKPWVDTRPTRPHDTYGKVDFDNDESATELTIHVERDADGGLTVHIFKHIDSDVRVNIEED